MSSLPIRQGRRMLGTLSGPSFSCGFQATLENTQDVEKARSGYSSYTVSLPESLALGYNLESSQTWLQN